MLSRQSGTSSRRGGGLGSTLLGSLGQRSGGRGVGGGLQSLVKLHYCKETPSIYKMTDLTRGIYAVNYFKVLKQIMFLIFLYMYSPEL
jgi:hypothetical protein